MGTYIRSQSAGEILRNSAHLYQQHFRKFFLTYLLPLFPFPIFYIVSVELQSCVLMSIALILMTTASLFAGIPITVMLSDICLGNEPSVHRAYRRAFGRSAGQLIGTFFLYTGIVLGGFILCIIPGLIFSIWYTFATIVVILERLAGRRALRRSKELGQGFYLRNFGVLFLCSMIVQVGSALVGFALAQAATALGLHNLVAGIPSMAVSLLLSPITLIAAVLLYYDMRARKEAYDSAALAEDLRR
jgi:hypothetical protein